MPLMADEPRVIRKLDHLDQADLRRTASLCRQFYATIYASVRCWHG